MKRVISMILCLMLVLGMATTASAANVVNETTHNYRAYQVFSGTQDANAVNLGNVEWGSGVNGDELMAALKAAYPSQYSAISTAAGVAGFLATDSENNPKIADAENFANIAVEHLNVDQYTEISANAKTVDLAPGYYLIVDVSTDPELNENAPDARNTALLQVTNAGDVYITKKYDVPEIDKNIRIAKGETFEAKNVGEFNIGDTVTFELNAKTPNNVDDFKAYKMVFHDKMSDGLINPTNVKLIVKGQEVTRVQLAQDDPETTENEAKWNFTVTTNPADSCKVYGAACDIEVIIEDAKLLGVGNHEVVTVTYDATVGPNIEINKANPNEYVLEFSNDPNWSGTETRPDNPTGVTPPSEVEVYSTSVTLLKKDGTTGAVLTGAEFTLTGDMNQVVVKTETVYVAYTDTNYEEDNKHWLLNDGSYTTEAPTGEPEHDSSYADTTTVYKKVEGVETVMGADTENTTIASYVGADGKVTFSGLGVGTYIIKETDTPDGYNTVADLKLEVSFDENTKTFHYTWSGGASGTSHEVIVRNYRGSVLPETGGMGTTMFYTVGGLMVAAAAILLITKKRMGAEA